LINVIVVGGSGFGHEIFQYVRDIARSNADIHPKGIIDDYSRPNEAVIGDTTTYHIQDDDRFIISVGDPNLRCSIAERLTGRGAKFWTLIHPLAYVSPSARLSEGCIVSPYASVGSNSMLEPHVLLVMYAAVAHDTNIGAYSSFSPYSVANGGVNVGPQSFFGSHAVVVPMRRVGEGSKLAAGAVVYRDVPDRSLAFGNPARIYPLLDGAAENGFDRPEASRSLDPGAPRPSPFGKPEEIEGRVDRAIG
jgi:sugar O-acyltransferase (sialic acid O-acetyltransferase NeuD family)